MSKQNPPDDAEVTRILVGRWECHREINHGLTWKYFCEFQADGRCRNWGTADRNGVSTDFENSGAWRVENGRLFYKVDHSSIKEILGKELVDPVLTAEEDKVVFENTQGDEVVIQRIRS